MMNRTAIDLGTSANRRRRGDESLIKSGKSETRCLVSCKEIGEKGETRFIGALHNR
jgi:hypothetical protein